MTSGDAEGRVEIPDAAKPGSGRKSRGGGEVRQGSRQREVTPTRRRCS